MEILRILLETRVLAASSSDASIAKSHRLHISDDIQYIGQAVLGVFFDFFRTGWRVIIENRFCPI